MPSIDAGTMGAGIKRRIMREDYATDLEPVGAALFAIARAVKA
jgi:hypothetical protein